MPPKAKPPAPSKKAEAKKKEKVIEDKTFGLKNKKGAKQQKFIQQVEKQVKNAGIPARKLDPAKDPKKKDDDEIKMLFRPVATQKIEKGADPKSIVCAFFKQGQCGKGNKCKFSHDLSIERKAEKRSLYVDMRDDGDENDTMDSWDEAKLAEVVEKKHGEAEKKKPTTDIICKYFLDAVEKSKYGWFWQCPNGPTCIYRHALPPGFVLKKDKKKEDKKDEISLEDLIERERAALGSNLTKVTLETFIAWKKRKLQEKKDKAAKDEEKKRIDFKAGRQVGISGREMFSFNPELAQGDLMEEGDEAFDSYNREEEEEGEEVQYREIQLDLLAAEATEADNTGTQAAEDRMTTLAAESAAAAVAAAAADSESAEGATGTSGDMDQAGAAGTTAINENLFLEDELEGLDDELDDLELSDQSDQ